MLEAHRVSGEIRRGRDWDDRSAVERDRRWHETGRGDGPGVLLRRRRVVTFDEGHEGETHTPDFR